MTNTRYFILQERLHTIPVKYWRVHDFKSLAKDRLPE